MSEQDNLRIVRSGYEAFGRGDLHALLELFDDNIDWMSPGPPELPTAGRRRGRPQVAEFFERVDELFDIQQFEPHTFIAQGDHVVVLGRETSRIKPTGSLLSSDWAHVFTVRNGRITRFQEYIDTAALVADLRRTQARA